jgi:hypothetical protein
MLVEYEKRYIPGSRHGYPHLLLLLSPSVYICCLSFFLCTLFVVGYGGSGSGPLVAVRAVEVNVSRGGKNKKKYIPGMPPIHLLLPVIPGVEVSCRCRRRFRGVVEHVEARIDMSTWLFWSSYRAEKAGVAVRGLVG